MASDFVDYSDLFSLNCFNSVCKVRDYFRHKQEKSLFVSPEVISNTPNKNLDTPKEFFVTLGVFCFYAERQNVPHILTFSLGMPL